MNYKKIDTPLIENLLLDKSFIRFLFDKNKIYYETDRSDPKNKKDLDALKKLIIHIYKSFKIKTKFNWECQKKGDVYSIFLFKENIDSTKGNVHLKNGKYFNIPECCLNKYIEEQKGSKITSYNSAKRYLEQCNNIKIKEDIFRIKVMYKGADCFRYGFIPCSPKCKEALRIVKITDELQIRLIESLEF